MKKLGKFLSFIAIAAIIGLVMFACNDGTTSQTDPCANGHTPGAAATCETAQTCTVCSYVIIAATGHNFGEWEEDVILASCTSASKDKASCLNGNCTKTEERTGSHPSLGHDLPGAHAATCMATGLTGIGHCNRCNQDLTGEVIPIDPDNHDFSEWTQITAATCVAPEKQERVCSYNAAHTEEQNHGEIDTTAHDWNWTLNVIAATCVSASKDVEVCKNTPCTVTNNEREGSNPALGHDHGTSGTGSLICKRENCDHQYAIGDTGPAGGTIFYVKTGGFAVEGYTGTTGSFAQYTAYYMEAAPANEGSSIRWGAYRTLIADVTTFTESSDSKASLIGNGRKDTLTIVNDPAFADLTGTAAQVCASKTVTVGGTVFNDWFLPSLGEVNEMYKTRTHLEISAQNIWSSSQLNITFAWSQGFGNGLQDVGYKDIDFFYVHAVRAF